MPRDNREVENILLTKFRFSRAERRGDDHRWVLLKVPDLPPILTKFSHTREDIGEQIWGLIAKQLKVRTPYLNGMVDCTNSRDDYYQQVRTDPFPPWPHITKSTAAQSITDTAQHVSGKRPRKRGR